MGRAVVQKLLGDGYHVIGTMDPKHTEPFDIDNSAFEKVTVDLMNEDATEKFIQDIISKHNFIDVAVLTVGGFAMGSIAETKTSDIFKQYHLNFETAYNVARPCFVQMMLQKRGRIFLTGSKPGLSAANSKGMVAYGLGKSMLFRLAELMNAEAKGTNVVTNVIVPGTIDTAQNRNGMPNADFNAWVKPEAIANVIYFYCTAAADVIRDPVIKIYNNA
jgi:NAD(P)-dependent dehydrogenase (short-subunit alcohol dehydrogenase family)